jgi:hypothetical protein
MQFVLVDVYLTTKNVSRVINANWLQITKVVW